MRKIAGTKNGSVAACLLLFAGAAVLAAQSAATATPDASAQAAQVFRDGKASDAPASDAAPDWMVWRFFYNILKHQQRASSPSSARQWIIGKTGLTADEADGVLNAGGAYLRELDSIYDRAQADIHRDFGSDPATASSPVHQRHLEFLRSRGIDPASLTPARTPDGRPIKEALATGGHLARWEEWRQTAFRDHWDALAESIGLLALLRLEQYVKTDFAPNVHVSTVEMPLQPR